MKPSHDDQRTGPPATDKKFRQEDKHILAKNKEEVALSPHGDKQIPKTSKHEEHQGPEGPTESK